MIYVNNRSPKKLRMQRKKQLAKKQEQYQEWLTSLEKLKPNFGTPGTKILWLCKVVKDLSVKHHITIRWKRLEVSQQSQYMAMSILAIR